MRVYRGHGESRGDRGNGVVGILRDRGSRGRWESKEVGVRGWSGSHHP